MKFIIIIIITFTPIIFLSISFNGRVKTACNGTARVDIVFRHKHVPFSTGTLLVIWVLWTKDLVNLTRLSAKYKRASCSGSFEETVIVLVEVALAVAVVVVAAAAFSVVIIVIIVVEVLGAV